MLTVMPLPKLLPEMLSVVGVLEATNPAGVIEAMLVVPAPVLLLLLEAPPPPQAAKPSNTAAMTVIFSVLLIEAEFVCMVESAFV
jgi:hypothetical protein